MKLTEKRVAGGIRPPMFITNILAVPTAAYGEGSKQPAVPALPLGDVETRQLTSSSSPISS